jgi:flagellar basal body-associated protein FliL
MQDQFAPQAPQQGVVQKPHHPHSLLLMGITIAVVVAAAGGSAYLLLGAKQAKQGVASSLRAPSPATTSLATASATPVATPTSTPEPTPMVVVTPAPNQTQVQATKEEIKADVKSLSNEVKDAIVKMQAGL